MTTSLLVRDVELDGEQVDVYIEAGRIVAIGRSLVDPTRVESIDGGGGALLPGFHDHHIHLFALAARSRSLSVGGPGVRNPAEFDAVLSAAARERRAGEWIRAVDHEPEVGGRLDRRRLDALAPDHPVRVQHRSGAQWILNSAAMVAVGLSGRGADLPDGVEIDGSGEPTGVLWRLDGWLRGRLPGPEPPDFAAVGRRLASFGIIGVTDATPTTEPAQLDEIATAVQTRALPIDVVAMCAPVLVGHPTPPPLTTGPVKLVIGDHAAPDVDQLIDDIVSSHAAFRSVAIHCVTRVAAAVALSAWRAAGARAGDRMEHASVADEAILAELHELGIIVVTQPVFVCERGDHYLARVDTGDLPDLYAFRSMLAAGIPTAWSSDAPHGNPNPWLGIAAAINRKTAGGRHLQPSEGLDPASALARALTPAHDPGGAARRIAIGASASLCVLDRGLREALADPVDVSTVVTVHAGTVTHRRRY